MNFDDTTEFSVMCIVKFAVESQFGDLIVQYFESATEIVVEVLVLYAGCSDGLDIIQLVINSGDPAGHFINYMDHDHGWIIGNKWVDKYFVIWGC